MKIKRIQISGVGGISDLALDFDPRMNIICGPNGIGKTTVLESVAHCFTHGATSILKRNVAHESSRIHAEFDADSAENVVDLTFQEFEPNKNAQISGRHDQSKYLLSLKTTRTFAYQPLDQISRDAQKAAHILWSEAMFGVGLGDIKNWFVNRYLYSAHEGALKPEQVLNFELAKRCFSALNPKFAFKRVDASSNEIIVSSPSGDIYYEYLSSGFKSCLSILFGIIKEIEFRFEGESRKAESFNGVVLIDEIDLHLHPDWQAKIQKVLLETFRDAQFIATTHSPHVIQSADPNQIIALENLGSGVSLRRLPDSEHGFKGWTLDEVLIDVMGMTDTRSQAYLELIEGFNDAINKEDLALAESLFVVLDAALHPNNAMRKLLRIQLNSLRSSCHDKT